MDNCWTNKTLDKCLENKQVFFLGDSNARQYTEYLLKVLQQPKPSGFLWYSYVSSSNISIHWQFHPEWISSGWSPWATHRYEADMFDSFVNSDCNYVIVVSSWAYFTQWTRSAIIERYLLLRQAVDRFHARCPDAPVIIKSPHAREHKDFEARVYSSDFILNELRKIMRDIFADSPGVVYLDIWDMNLAHPAKNSVHMPEPVIEQELAMLWSYVCDCED